MGGRANERWRGARPGPWHVAGRGVPLGARGGRGSAGRVATSARVSVSSAPRAAPSAGLRHVVGAGGKEGKGGGGGGGGSSRARRSGAGGDAVPGERRGRGSPGRGGGGRGAGVSLNRRGRDEDGWPRPGSGGAGARQPSP